jgi:hypothetical protein
MPLHHFYLIGTWGKASLLIGKDKATVIVCLIVVDARDGLPTVIRYVQIGDYRDVLVGLRVLDDGRLLFFASVGYRSVLLFCVD